MKRFDVTEKILMTFVLTFFPALALLAAWMFEHGGQI